TPLPCLRSRWRRLFWACPPRFVLKGGEPRRSAAGRPYGEAGPFGWAAGLPRPAHARADQQRDEENREKAPPDPYRSPKRAPGCQPRGTQRMGRKRVYSAGGLNANRPDTKTPGGPRLFPAPARPPDHDP